MIYLLRHGLDDENYIGGWSNVNLISEGIKQVEDVSKYIVEKELVINNIISSDIKRCKSTSLIVNNFLNLDIVYSSCLRELDKGNFTGVLKNNLSSEEKNMINGLGIYDKYPNGEAMIDLYKRIKNYLESIKDMDNVLLITHRGVINMFYYLLNDIKLDMNKKRFNVEHASLHEMNVKKKIIRRIY